MNLGLKSGEMQSFEGFEKTLKRTEASVPNSRKSVGSFPGYLGNDPIVIHEVKKSYGRRRRVGVVFSALTFC